MWTLGVVPQRFAETLEQKPKKQRKPKSPKKSPNCAKAQNVRPKCAVRPMRPKCATPKMHAKNVPPTFLWKAPPGIFCLHAFNPRSAPKLCSAQIVPAPKLCHPLLRRPPTFCGDPPFAATIHILRRSTFCPIFCHPGIFCLHAFNPRSERHLVNPGRLGPSRPRKKNRRRGGTLFTCKK